MAGHERRGVEESLPVTSRTNVTSRRLAAADMPSLPPLPASRLLVGGRRLLLLPRLVGIVGLNEAIVLQQIRYYLEDERQPRVANGCRWVRAPLSRWQERDFPFWTTRTIERTFASLITSGLIVSRQLDIRSGDATNSYTIAWTRLAALDRRPPEAASWSGAGADDTIAVAGLPPLPASNYLDEEDLLPIGVRLAALIGLDEAVVLRQIYYWLGDRRRPPIRDGRRWVCPSQVPFWEALAFRSRKTIQRTLQELERRGLLVSCAAYNSSARDRTKWYTVDFDVLEALEACEESVAQRPTPPINPECRDGTTQNVAIEQPDLSASNDPTWHHATDQIVAIERPDVAASLKGSKTDRETTQKKEQQRTVAHDVEMNTTGDDVVVESLVDRDLGEELAGVGVTVTVARRLIATHSEAHVRHHLDIHTWECAEQPGRAQLTPGRLRRRIEEDWATPPGYRTPAERALADAERAQDTLRREERSRQQTAAAAARDREQRERLAAVGLRVDDQAFWARLAHETPALPLLFREALFYAPRGAAPAALIFLARAEAERANAVAHRASRAAIAKRLALVHGRAIEIRYLWYDDVLRLVRDDVTDSAVAASGTMHGDA